ncbi:alpha-2,8-polysialyltransferase family protein [Polaribacter sp. Hel1_85]|uniref:alpha-2,8-polysialyltransferase family protein n=1 Tax=Polaribacter sp. Hel1_85 TaxID=1250005 RepID=UPI00052CA316|nr:alpha-2,8-polysialyltransferase family protein [Polaribacter sp. Hel1_85]KGL64357.1 hypothetical protein PHEL85_1412 [Polaribacter sp. Hel1_85]
MKKNIFIFSSPLQFLFSSLTASQLEQNSYSIGYYYVYHKNFTNIYKMISDFLGDSMSIILPIEEMDVNDINFDDTVYFSNRYSSVEIELFYKCYDKTTNLNLYEEGFNTYLKHHFNNPKKSEYNTINNIKNFIKVKIRGKRPNLIKLEEFKNIYTTFKIDHLKNNTNWIPINFVNSNEIQKSNDSCLFLSQSLVQDSLIDKNIFIDFLESYFSKIGLKYKTIYFKPHPRDDIEMINEIIRKNKNLKLLPEKDSDLPAEILLVKKPMDVIGFSSSTLIYANSLLKITSYECLSDLVKMNKTNYKIQSYYKSVKVLFNKHKISKIN